MALNRILYFLKHANIELQYLPRSKTYFSSHAGMTPVPKEKCVPPDDRDLAELNVKPMLKDSPVLSNDLEWDHDLPNDQAETKKLLDKTKSSEEEEEMDR